MRHFECPVVSQIYTVQPYFQPNFVVSAKIPFRPHRIHAAYCYAWRTFRASVVTVSFVLDEYDMSFGYYYKLFESFNPQNSREKLVRFLVGSVEYDREACLSV